MICALGTINIANGFAQIPTLTTKNAAKLDPCVEKTLNLCKWLCSDSQRSQQVWQTCLLAALSALLATQDIPLKTTTTPLLVDIARKLRNAARLICACLAPFPTLSEPKLSNALHKGSDKSVVCQTESTRCKMLVLRQPYPMGCFGVAKGC